MLVASERRNKHFYRLPEKLALHIPKHRSGPGVAPGDAASTIHKNNRVMRELK
jgi:hypothetical protein